jgi:hypothetical protein
MYVGVDGDIYVDIDIDGDRDVDVDIDTDGHGHGRGVVRNEVKPRTVREMRETGERTGETKGRQRGARMEDKRKW